MQFLVGGALGRSSSPSSGVVLNTVTVSATAVTITWGAGYGGVGVDAGYAVCCPRPLLQLLRSVLPLSQFRS